MLWDEMRRGERDRKSKWILNENRKHTKTEEWGLLRIWTCWRKEHEARKQSSKDAEDDGNTAINRAGKQHRGRCCCMCVYGKGDVGDKGERFAQQYAGSINRTVL